MVTAGPRTVQCDTSCLIWISHYTLSSISPHYMNQNHMIRIHICWVVQFLYTVRWKPNGTLKNEWTRAEQYQSRITWLAGEQIQQVGIKYPKHCDCAQSVRCISKKKQKNPKPNIFNYLPLPLFPITKIEAQHRSFINILNILKAPTLCPRFGTTLFLLLTMSRRTIQARDSQQQVSQASSSCGSEKHCSDQSLAHTGFLWPTPTLILGRKKMIWYQYISWYLSGLCSGHTSAITQSRTWYFMKLFASHVQECSE